MPRLTIKQEVRNAPTMAALRQYCNVFERSNGRPPKHWVAKITGFHKAFYFRREFVNGVTDWSEANSKGSRFVYIYWHLDDGIYEACLDDDYRKRFLKVADGGCTEISKDEVCEWLNGHSELMS